MNSEPEEAPRLDTPNPRALWQAVLRQQQLQLLSHIAALNPSLLLRSSPEDKVSSGSSPPITPPVVTRKPSSRKAPSPSREKVFTCKICERSFGYKHVLQNHERTHTGEKPFACKVCAKRFTRDHHLKTHMRLHTGEKPYSCSHCDRQFVQVANLRRHLRVHTGEKPYKCSVCPAAFSDSNQLKAHLLGPCSSNSSGGGIGVANECSSSSSPPKEGSESSGTPEKVARRKPKDPKRINTSLLMMMEPQTEPEDLSKKDFGHHLLHPRFNNALPPQS